MYTHYKVRLNRFYREEIKKVIVVLNRKSLLDKECMCVCIF